MISKLTNKKGISDVVFVVAILFVIALSFLVILFISTTLRDNMVPAITIMDNTSGAMLNQTISAVPQTIDTAFLIILVGLIIGVLISSFLFYSHPIFMILYIILSVGALLISVIFSNVYETVSTTSGLNSTIASMPIANYVMLHLPLFVLGIIALSIIIIYAKSQMGGANQGGQL